MQCVSVDKHTVFSLFKIYMSSNLLRKCSNRSNTPWHTTVCMLVGLCPPHIQHRRLCEEEFSRFEQILAWTNVVDNLWLTLNGSHWPMMAHGDVWLSFLAASQNYSPALNRTRGTLYSFNYPNQINHALKWLELNLTICLYVCVVTVVTVQELKRSLLW